MHEKNEFNQPIGGLVEHWQPVKKPPKTAMRGNYCVLEPLNIDEHAAKLFAALSSDNPGDSWTYLSYGPFKTCTEFQDWLRTLAADDDILFYAILDIKTQLPIGIASYLRINPAHGVIEVGHLHYSKLLQKTPAATEAMYLMMHRVFEELKYRRYEWKCNALNKSSCNAAERLGFKFEGIFRQHLIFKNRNRDTAWFSIIDSEWPALKAKFQRWLNPDNFASNGRQLLSLRQI